jgi:hypothetical protein
VFIVTPININIRSKNNQLSVTQQSISLFLTNIMIHMTRVYLIITALIIPLFIFSQGRDQTNWVDFGGTNPSQYLQIATAKMGPNALPVPRMNYAQIGNESKFELGSIYHQMNGDTTLNSYFNFFWNIAPGRAVVEVWGQPTETFRMSNAIRDFRQVTPDDTGWNTEAGDIWISTTIQLLKESKYIPGFCLNYTTKMTTGSNLNARYTDANLNYIYLAAGKSFLFDEFLLDEIRIAGFYGFYVWQTNKAEMGQDEGPVFEGGIQLRKGKWNWYSEFGGYVGYDAYEFILRNMNFPHQQGYNDPLILRNRIELKGNQFNFSIEHQMGFRDYPYQTIKIGTIFHFPAKF